MPPIIAILAHLGSLVKAGKDIEQTLADVVAKKSVGADLAADLADLGTILAVFPVPGLDPAIVAKAISDIQSAI